MRRAGILVFLAGVFVAVAGSVHAQSLPPEVQVGSRVITDFEFDWGRDGTYCATCNYGDGNNRLTFIDPFGYVWIGHVDVATGDFVPSNGEGTLVDFNGVPSMAIGNGSEWVNLPQASALVYTRYKNTSSTPGKCIGVAYAQSDGGWNGGCMAGTDGDSLPIGTAIVGDPYPMVSFQNNLGSGFNLYWQFLSRGSTAQVVFPDSRAPPSHRWIPNSHAMVLVAPAAPDASGKVYRQVFLYSTDDGTLQQLTFDPTNKNSPFMWQAPEFNNKYVFLQVPGNSRDVDLYRYLPTNGGSPSWQVFKRISGTADYPYIFSPEPFVYQGKSWVFFELASAPHKPGAFAPSQIAMSGIDPDVPSFRVLTEDVAPNFHARRDPEYYITSMGPYLYYNRIIPAPPGGEAQSEGVFRVDTGLGPAPTGGAGTAVRPGH
jgi:hypothetical protein